MENTTNIYFATKEGKDTASVLLSKAEAWSNNIESSGYLEKLKAMWAAYHGAYYNDVSDGHQISFSGEQGELVQLPINHLRNLGSHIITMTTSNRPTMETRAVNTDYKSISQCKLANGILEYYMREKRLEKYLKIAVEYAVVLGAGFIKMEWNATTGEIYDYFEDETTGEPDPNRPIYEGDIEFSNLSPFDVVMDGTKEHQNHDWLLVRSFKNKYDLAVKYPEFADKIKGLKTKSDIERFRVGITNLNDETDDVPVYEFYHRRTDALPNGRYMLFLDEEIVLQDIGMPYRVIPVFRISSGDILGSPYGYTPLFDVLPVQEAINTLYSTILTNQNASGVQNFWSKPGSNLNVSSLGGGLNLIESMEKPEVLELCHTPKEIFDFLQMLERVAETLTGVNSVARGNPEASLKTGAALALVQSMALQFMSGLQQSYVQLIEDVGGGIIKILQDYAKAPRMLAIVGKSSRTELKEFVGDDISNITRVYVDVGNPLAKTIAGRMELAQQMMQYQIIKNPNQLIEVLNTGKLEALTEDLQNELDLIRAENEKLMDGENPPVTMIDDHKEHIMEHRKVLQDPDLRKDAKLVQNTLDHIQAHITQLQTGDPNLLQLLGQQPLPPPGPPPGQGPQAGGPPGNPQQGPMGTPEQGQSGMTQQQGPSGPTMNAPGMQQNIPMPNLPKVDPNMLPNPALQQQQGPQSQG
jgi:hypothetical protein